MPLIDTGNSLPKLLSKVNQKGIIITGVLKTCEIQRLVTEYINTARTLIQGDYKWQDFSELMESEASPIPS